jgi:DHA2 family multidrug resistance protein
MSAWVFCVHSRTTRHPFLQGALLKDRNFVTGGLLIFFIGGVLITTMALLPPYMQHVMGYSVLEVGFLMTPRGIGSMIAMIIVGKTGGHFPLKPLMMIGLSLTAFSLWQMTHFSVFVPASDIILSSVIQGIGLGLTLVPLSTLTFKTLSPHLRSEGTALFSLLRNLGGSTGVSLIITLIAQKTQLFHAQLAEHITVYNISELVTTLKISLPQMNHEITRQATTIAYLNSFYGMLCLTVALLPGILLLREK